MGVMLASSEQSSSSLHQALSRSMLALILLVPCLLLFFYLRRQRQIPFPSINKRAGFWIDTEVQSEFTTSAKDLIESGLKKFGGPFSLTTTSGNQLILPSAPEYIDWVKSNANLSHMATLKADYFTNYPGFEGVAAISDTRYIMVDAIKKHLSKNESSISLAREQILECLGATWTNDSQWHSIDWCSDARIFTSHMSTAVFLGPKFARNERWHTLATNYTMGLFSAARALRSWPAVLRPLVHWLLPDCKRCREQMTTARQMLKEEFASRKESEKREKREDSTDWMEQAAAGRPYDVAATQLGLASVAIHGTSQLLTQTLIDFCKHPALIEPLQDEVKAAVSQYGFTTAGLSNMKLLDSVIKETQRLKPGVLVNLERMATRPVTLPDGTTLPAGTQLGVSSFPSAFADPETYVGDRFNTAANAAQLVSSSNQHFAFGLGKSLCPGRFLAANVIKTALATVLLEYDVRLESGTNPEVLCVGFDMLSDPEVSLQVKKRV